MATASVQTPAATEANFEQMLADSLISLGHLALRYTRDAGRADDLVHDTVVRALRFRNSYRPGSNFRAWTYTILTNTFIHGYRRSRKEHDILLHASRGDVQHQLCSDTTAERAQRPESVLLFDHLSDDVVAALAGLAEDFRTVVVLCDLQGHSYREVAEAIGCPLGTVMSRLHRGRRQLETRLQAYAQSQGIGRGAARSSAVAA